MNEIVPMRSTSGSPTHPAAAAPSFAQKVDTVIGFLQRRWMIISVCVAAALPFGAINHFFAKPTYTSSSTIMVDPRVTQLFPNSLVPDASRDPSWVENQIGVLKSQGVAAYVVKQLRLADDPEFLREDPGVFASMLESVGVTAGLKKIGLGGALIAVGLAESDRPRSEAERIGEAQGAFTRRIDVKRVGLSNMLRVEFRSRNPDQAVKVANTMVDAYIYDQLTAKYQANRRASDWLLERLQVLREDAANAERAVLEFKSKNNIVAAAGRLVTDQEMVDATSKLATSKAAATDIQARLNRIDAVIKSGQSSADAGFDETIAAADETTSDAMQNSIIGQLRKQYLDLVNREMAWSAQYGKNHVAVINLQKQIRDIRRSMMSELIRIRESLKSEYEIASQRQATAEKTLADVIAQSKGVNQAQITLFNLEATAQSYRRLYDNFLQRHTEAVQQQTLPVTEARAISPAAVYQTGPKRGMIWLTTLLAGAGIGVGFGALRELMDRGFRTKEQVQSALSLQCLSLVPVLTDRAMLGILNDPRTRALQARTSATVAEVIRNTMVSRIHKTSRLMRTVQQAPDSILAESVRMIRLNLELEGQSESRRVLGVTSAFPGEGKSSLAAALATVIAQGGQQVILVDCDLRNPSLSRALSPDAKLGVVDAIHGHSNFQELIWTDPTTNLSFLPGAARAAISPSEFLASPEAATLFSALRKVFDYVIVDLPPLLAATDVRAASQLLDSYLLVVEWGQTKIDAVQYALRHAPGVYERTAGIVLNKVDVEAMGRYDTYGGMYYGYSYGTVPGNAPASGRAELSA